MGLALTLKSPSKTRQKKLGVEYNYSPNNYIRSREKQHDTDTPFAPLQRLRCKSNPIRAGKILGECNVRVLAHSAANTIRGSPKSQSLPLYLAIAAACRFH